MIAWAMTALLFALFVAAQIAVLRSWEGRWLGIGIYVPILAWGLNISQDMRDVEPAAMLDRFLTETVPLSSIMTLTSLGGAWIVRFFMMRNP
jgi:hypothetical protein